MDWKTTLFTYIWVFNTGRGLSVCVRFPHNIGLLYDLGNSDEFSPYEFVAQNIAPKLTRVNGHKLGQLILSHPHDDHIREVPDWNTKNNLSAQLITCPNEKAATEMLDFSRIEREDNKVIIAQYRQCYGERKPPLQTISRSMATCYAPNVSYGLYYMQPPAVDKIHASNNQHYGNGVSLNLLVQHGKQSVLLTGDTTPEVMKELLKGGKTIERRYTYFSSEPAGVPQDFNARTSTQPTLQTLLSTQGLTALIAPHHGLESCYSPELFQTIKGGKPIINIISEKRHTGVNDGKIHQKYQSSEGALGCKVDIDGSVSNQYSVSTKNGHHILIVLRGTCVPPDVYLRSNPNDLLNL